MAAFVGDFGDAEDEEGSGPLLPPEDRLWRHPSELGATGEVPILDQQLVRRRWLASEPSRASAWTAGLVGAVLATGLVALGTHLATAFTGPKSPSKAAHATVTSAPLRSQAATITPGDLSPALQRAIHTIGDTIVYVETGPATDAPSARTLGVVVNANGTIVVPAAALDGSSSVVVLLGDGMPYVGMVLGSDPSSGLAVVKLNGVRQLPVTLFSGSAMPETGSYALAITTPGGTSISAGSVLASSYSSEGPLIDPVLTDLPGSHCPLGSVLIDASGQAVGIVSGVTSNGTLVTPGYMVAPIATELVRTGGVLHGWLGIDGMTAARNAGVQVLTVEKNGAAARAGIRVGDVISSIDAIRVTSMTALVGELYVLKPTTKVVLAIHRDGETLRIGATLSPTSG